MPASRILFTTLLTGKRTCFCGSCLQVSGRSSLSSSASFRSQVHVGLKRKSAYVCRASPHSAVEGAWRSFSRRGVCSDSWHGQRKKPSVGSLCWTPCVLCQMKQINVGAERTLASPPPSSQCTPHSAPSRVAGPRLSCEPPWALVLPHVLRWGISPEMLLASAQQKARGWAEGREAAPRSSGPDDLQSWGPRARPASHRRGTLAPCEELGGPGASGAPRLWPPCRPQPRLPVQSLPFPASQGQAASPWVSQALADRRLL